MKPILKIILLCALLFSSVAANINEYKSDLYYANGIMIGETSKKALNTWKKKINDLFSNNQDILNKSINIKVSYNASENLFNDLFEAFQQSGNEQGWLTFSQYIPTYYGNNIPDSVDTHRPDLITQINAYKESIKLGHSVIIIAHSQGNYYTNEAYEELDEWMKPYFHMMGVATPADHVAGGGPYVTFHNDIIKLVPTALSSNRDDPNTNHNSLVSYDAHDFYSSYMSADNTRTDIQDFILNKIEEHKSADSQWEVQEELKPNTEDYKVTLKHKFDTSITTMQDIEVYPFNLEQKLYHVINYTINGNGNKGNGWVMASFGGEEILDSWTGKKDSEFYMINNLEKEIIAIINQISFYINFNLTYSIKNENTSYHYATARKHIADGVNCNFSNSGSGRNIYSPFTDLGDTYYLENDLSRLRDDYERYYNKGRFHSEVECIIQAKGYEVSDVEPIMERGAETRILVDNSSLKKSYLLKQEYIIIPK